MDGAGCPLESDSVRAPIAHGIEHDHAIVHVAIKNCGLHAGSVGSAPNATSIVLRGEIRAGSDGGRRGESTSRTLTPRGPAEDPRADVGRGHARLGFNEAAGIPRGGAVPPQPSSSPLSQNTPGRRVLAGHFPTGNVALSSDVAARRSSRLAANCVSAVSRQPWHARSQSSFPQSRIFRASLATRPSSFCRMAV